MPLTPKNPDRRRTKTEPAPAPTATEPSLLDRALDAVQGNESTTTSNPKLRLQGTAGINHGLNLPVFDPNQYFASNLFTDSSRLERTTKQKADQMVESIAEKRQTLRIAQENIGLDQDLVRTASDHRKLEGMAIDYASVLVQNQTKYLNYQIAGVNQQVSGVKLQTAQEKLTQESKTFAGVRSMTALIDAEWEQRRALKLSRISDLKQAVLTANAQMDQRLNQLSNEFNNDLNALPG